MGDLAIVQTVRKLELLLPASVGFQITTMWNLDDLILVWETSNKTCRSKGYDILAINSRWQWCMFVIVKHG